jgi:hypothetical protein
MVRLTMIPKDVALTAPVSELPHPARKTVRDEIRELAKGSKREAEVMEWLDGWTGREEALALIAELKVEREERKHRLPEQSLETALKADTQSGQRAFEFAEDELAKAQAQRDEEKYRELAQLVNYHAIEQGYAQRQWELLAERRYDPLGFYGPPNYET